MGCTRIVVPRCKFHPPRKRKRDGVEDFAEERAYGRHRHAREKCVCRPGVIEIANRAKALKSPPKPTLPLMNTVYWLQWYHPDDDDYYNIGLMLKVFTQDLCSDRPDASNISNEERLRENNNRYGRATGRWADEFGKLRQQNTLNGIYYTLTLIPVEWANWIWLDAGIIWIVVIASILRFSMEWRYAYKEHCFREREEAAELPWMKRKMEWHQLVFLKITIIVFGRCSTTYEKMQLTKFLHWFCLIRE